MVGWGRGGVSVGAKYSFNGTEAAKLAFEIGLLDVVAQTRHEQRPVGVATHLGIAFGLVCDR